LVVNSAIPNETARRGRASHRQDPDFVGQKDDVTPGYDCR
jgi:hypothetical protein